MPLPPRRPLSVLLVFLFAPAAATLFAQTNSEVNSGIQFSFSPPGARSLALAGAFVALADDATAAYANPAGLTNLSKPEVSLEGRVSKFTNEYIFGGRLNGAPTTGADNNPNEVDHKSDDTVRNLSFVSFVYPGKTWAVAVYRDELANFRAHSKTEGAFFDAGTVHGFRLKPVISTLDLKIVNYGASLAFRFGDTFSLGAGVSRFEYTQHTVLDRYNVNPSTAAVTPATYADANRTDSEILRGDDNDLTFNAGILWKATPRFAIGAVYRRGPEFTDLTSTTTVFATPNLVTTTPAVFRVPDVFAVGVAARPINALTLSFDYDRVRYSQLASKILDVQVSNFKYTTEDADEFRFGAQYVLQIGTSSLALRAGAWHEPDHTLRSTQSASSADPGAVADAFLFRGGPSKTHYTGGLGVTVGEHFQLDAGVDSAKNATIGSLSLVVRM